MATASYRTFRKLAGRHPEYLVRELKEFVSGTRTSAIMTPIAAKLDPDDFKALGEYFGAQKPTSGQVLDQKAAAIGMKLYQDGDEERAFPPAPVATARMVPAASVSRDWLASTGNT